MRWLIAVMLVVGSGAAAVGVGCTFSTSDSDRYESCPPTPRLGDCADDLKCTYGAEVCTCESGRFVCSSCGDFSQCTPGATCSFSDWERDCECGCTPHGHWSCTGFYQNYGCPTDSTYQDAGIDMAL